ncbi:MAG: acetyl-CoA C-acetyltransferase [Planctomycetes bacterium]|nr:acetyl-CoA C-acetyltransferase [Planctomycetota bacterium]
MIDVFIASAARTPVGKFLGSLSRLSAPRLGAVAVREAVRRAGLSPEDVEECFLGCVLQAGLGQNPARQAAMAGGLPASLGSVSVNKVCGSGLKAVILAAQAIRAGDLNVAVAGGMESMSNAPYLLPEARRGSRLGHARLLDAMVHDGLWDGYNDFHMGATCELVAEHYRVSRHDMDEFAVASHRKAAAALRDGSFRRESVPVEVSTERGETKLVETDEGVREDVSIEKLAQLKPAFKPDGGVTPGNASQISDGAAALVVMSGEEVRRRGVKPLARITGYATGGVEPKWVMMAPLEALKNLEKKTGFTPRDADLVEINEAFAGSTVALIRELRLDPAKVNIRGGAVALGHPIGCSGARILVTLIYALQDRKLRKGLATLCMGGGNGLALTVEVA